MEASSVIKVGGSLLDLVDLPARLSNYLADFARPHPVLVCGGGPTVDLIRRWDRLYGMGEEEAHWIAVRALTLNSLVLEKAVPGLRLVESPGELPGVWGEKKVPLYDPYSFLQEVDDRSSDPLPRRWRVTSDSIAARMAALLGAPELVLLKSTTLTEELTIEEAARQGLVDVHFPLAARGVPRVLAVNLREDEIRETVLRARFHKSVPGST